MLYFESLYINLPIYRIRHKFLRHRKKDFENHYKNLCQDTHMVRTKDTLDNLNNLTKFSTLLLIHEKPKHGYEIIKDLEKKLQKKISAGNVYPFLRKLEKAGYIYSKNIGSREKKTYKLTSNGRLFVKNLLEKFDKLIDIAIEPKLTECAHCACKVYQGGYKKIIKSKTFAFCCSSCAESFR